MAFALDGSQPKQVDMTGSHKHGTLAAAAGIAVVGIAIMAAVRTDQDTLYFLGLVGMLGLAGVFGFSFSTRVGVTLSLILVLVAAASNTLALPDLEQALFDGAFWVGLAWVVLLVLGLAFWAIGRVIRAVVDAISGGDA